jgi:hypothetical protein
MIRVCFIYARDEKCTQNMNGYSEAKRPCVGYRHRRGKGINMRLQEIKCNYEDY